MESRANDLLAVKNEMRQPLQKNDEIKIKGVNRSFKVCSSKGQKAGAGLTKNGISRTAWLFSESQGIEHLF
ncbi:MAG TPA: hypothetical protein VFH42_04635 [Sporolactobacillaceae bacterium]|nr:hypothetical protein [Sporolactobacillaceae bacterium]